MRILFAVVHLLALGIGLGAVFVRARSANRLKDGPESLPALFAADTWWGVAAFLWISTGLTRVFASYEKSTAYYWSNHIFLAKMGLLLIVIALEIWPVITLIRWRRSAGRGTLPPTELSATGRRIARISDVQTLLVVAMVSRRHDGAWPWRALIARRHVTSRRGQAADSIWRWRRAPNREPLRARSMGPGGAAPAASAKGVRVARRRGSRGHRARALDWQW